jgi:hypothetical protein
MPVINVARRVRVATGFAQASIVASALALTIAVVLVFRAAFDIFMESATFAGLAHSAFLLPIVGFALALAAKQIGRGRTEVDGFLRIAFVLAGTGLILIVFPVTLNAITPHPPTMIIAN